MYYWHAMPAHLYAQAGVAGGQPGRIRQYYNVVIAVIIDRIYAVARGVLARTALPQATNADCVRRVIDMHLAWAL